MKRIIAFLLLLCLSISALPVSADNTVPGITASGYVLMDAANDAVILSENGNADIGINNFAKIMTAVLILEKGDLTPSVKFTADTMVFNNNFGNIAMVKQGQAYTVDQHLHNMLLLYSDASAHALAVWYSGNTKAFVEKMNQKAKALNMEDTVFTSPDGKADGKSGTTVPDLYKLFKHAMSLPAFREITAKDRFELPRDEGTELYSSRNNLISRYSFAAYTNSAVMSGFASYGESGSSLIAAAKSGDKELYAFVINTPDSGQKVYEEMNVLLRHGFSNFRSNVLVKKGAFLHQASIESAMQTEAVLVAEKDLSALLPVNYDEKKLTFLIDAPESIKAPLKKGAAYGKVTYYYDNQPLSSVNLIAEKDISHTPLAGLYRMFASPVTIPIMLILVVLVLLGFRYKKKQKKREELRRRKREILENNEEKR